MTRPPVRRAALAVLLALAASACSGGGAPEPDATPTAPASAAPSPIPRRPPATDGVAGDVLVDLSALAAGDAAALPDTLSVQACLGGQCHDREVDPAGLERQPLALDATGLAPGDTVPVTVQVVGPGGQVVAQHEEAVTLATGETVVEVRPR